MLKAILEESELINNEESRPIPIITSTLVESSNETDKKPQGLLNVKPVTDTSSFTMTEGEVSAEKCQHCGNEAEVG